jgi:hypothetical protein
MMREPILQMGTDRMIPRHAFHKSFMVRLPNRSEWDSGIVPLGKRGLIRYTDGSKTNKGTGAGVYGHDMGQRFSFSLGWYATVFQAAVYAIKALRNIYILSDSQAVIKHLTTVKSTLNWSGTAINP